MHKYLRTNAAHPMMANPGFPFPPMTNLLPTYDFVEQYHSDFASHYNLTSYIRFNHSVTSSVWVGNSTNGVWNLTYTRQNDALIQSELGPESQVVNEYKIFDHLVVATGTDHFPHYVKWPGLDDWLSKPDRERKAIHSIYYEGPEKYVNKTVLVVGDGGSGVDIMLHTTSVTRKVCVFPVFFVKHEFHSSFSPNSDVLVLQRSWFVFRQSDITTYLLMA